MTLTDLHNYIRDHGKATLSEISYAFKADAGVTERMLAVWVQKGKIRLHKPEASGQCRGCCSCDKNAGQYYEWQSTPFREL